jgi:hypothetical protein
MRQVCTSQGSRLQVCRQALARLDELSEAAGALALIWGDLTDAMDAPGTGSPEQDAAAVRQMKRASAEWLDVVFSPEGRASYVDHWVHDECGYAR